MSERLMRLTGGLVRQVADSFAARGQADRALELERRALKIVEDDLLFATTPRPAGTEQAVARREAPIPFYTGELAESRFRLYGKAAALQSIDEISTDFQDSVRGRFAELRTAAGDYSTALELLRDDRSPRGRSSDDADRADRVPKVSRHSPWGLIDLTDLIILKSKGARDAN